MQQIITKVNDTTVSVSIPQTISLDTLIKQKDFFQAKVDILNSQIAEAKKLGVLTQSEKLSTTETLP